MLSLPGSPWYWSTLWSSSGSSGWVWQKCGQLDTVHNFSKTKEVTISSTWMCGRRKISTCNSSLLPQAIKHMTLSLTNSFAFVATWAHVDILASQNYWRLSERNPKTKLLTNPVFPSIHHQHLHQYHNKPCVNILRVHPQWMLRLLHRVLQLGAGLQQQVGLVSKDGKILVCGQDGKIMKIHHESSLSGS